MSINEWVEYRVYENQRLQKRQRVIEPFAMVMINNGNDTHDVVGQEAQHVAANHR